MQELRPWVIYTLSDPETNEIRYVGVTHHPDTRLAEHLSKARKHRETNHRACWIRSLLAKSLKPIFKVIENGEGPDWVAREQHWIAYYRGLGLRLVNATDGGEGTLGYSPSPEWRARQSDLAIATHTGRKRSEESKAKMAESQRKRFAWEQEQGITRRGKAVYSPERLKRMSDAQKGKKWTPEQHAKMAEYRKNLPEETREKLRAATLARPKEQRDAWARNQTGKTKSPETKAKMAEARKQYWAGISPEERSARRKNRAPNKPKKG